MSKVLVNESSLTGIANAIRGKNGSADTYKPSEMAAAITAISGGGEPVIEALSVTSNGTYTAPDGVDGYSPVTVNVPQSGSPPEEAFVISGDCSYWDYNGKWDNFITAYADKWSTSNLVDCSSMFKLSKLTEIPFQINMSSDLAYSFVQMFNGAKIISLPTITGNNIGAGGLASFCSNSPIQNIPNEYFNFISYTSNSCSMARMFQNCSKLRNFPTSLNVHISGLKSSYYASFYNNAFNFCYVLDEIVNLGVSTLATLTYNSFSGIVSSCSRLKNFTFESGKTAKWESQTIDLSSYLGYASNSDNIINNGITADKQVTDDATYQALKDDPDWWTTNVAYSRYNHDSAVATINSLPDTSAYLAANGGSNTIKFKGESGSATDGGAINTLTEEEIAVATAKGWTVTLV